MTAFQVLFLLTVLCAVVPLAMAQMKAFHEMEKRS